MMVIKAFFVVQLFVASTLAYADTGMDFWKTPRHGANSFNRLPPDDEYLTALRQYGATWVRLSWDKWQADDRDFLLGNADDYTGLNPADLNVLRDTLARAHRAGLKVVITPLSLPGMRWSQNNQGRFDDRLWRDKEYWRQSEKYWRDLAGALKGHPAIAAYNLVNEPAPEKVTGLAEHAEPSEMTAWYARHRGSARDLPAFYEKLISAVREEDRSTPVMVDAGWYAAADAFSYWPGALSDARVLYSFHMYEPYSATSAPNLKRRPMYEYPGEVPFAAGVEYWDAGRVKNYLEGPVRWASEHNIPADRLVMGEFGCIRVLLGCRQYLEDVLQAADAVSMHWAFYAFREDSWDAMDYELGTAPVPYSYWENVSENRRDSLKREPTPEFEPISERLKAESVKTSE